MATTNNPFCRIALVALVALVACDTCLTQSWAEDRTRSAHYFALDRQLTPQVLERGSVSMSRAQTVLEWRTTSPEGGLPVTCAMPFDFVGSIGDTATPTALLVSGAASGNESGFLALVNLTGDALSQRAITLTSSVDYGVLFDPIRVRWSPHDNYLYVLDFRHEMMFAAPWDGSSPLPSAGSFSVVSAPITGLRAYDLVALETGGVFAKLPSPFVEEGVAITRDSQGIWHTTVVNAPSPPPNLVEVHNLSYLASNQDVYIRSEQTGPFDIVLADTNQVLYSSTIAFANAWVSVPSGVLSSNGRYQVRLNGDLNTAIMNPHLRWGDISTNAVVSRVYCGRGALSSPGPHVDFPDFNISGWIGLRDASTAPEGVLVVLVLGLDTGAPQIAQLGTLTVMAEPIVIAGPWPYTLTAAGESSSFCFNHPIPDDPGLVGTTPIYQWVALMPATGEMSASDVFGSPIYQ